MWQIQWAISLIPDSVLIWIYTFIMTAGVVLYLGSKLASRFPFKLIPFVGQYPFVAEWSGVFLMVCGVFLYGGYATEMEWRSRTAELEDKVKVAEQQSKNANAKLDSAIKEKNQAVQDNKYIILNRIKQDAAKIDKDCRIDSEAIEILNDSAKLPKAKK
jgi:hypothetical protein